MSQEYIKQFTDLMQRKRLCDLRRQTVQRKGYLAEEAERLERAYLERLYRK